MVTCQHNLQLTGSTAEIAQAFNDFNRQYLQGYFIVQAHVDAYLSASREADDPHKMEHLAQKLTTELSRVLSEWHAGRRKAPTLRSDNEITQFLLNPVIHTELAELSMLRTEPPGIEAGKRIVSVAHFTPNTLDMAALRLLNQLARGLFRNALNATYPMKALLLLTGYSIAFDSQVRGGAQRAGFEGMRHGSHKIADIARNANCATSRKIISMPYIVGQAWHENQERIKEALVATGRMDLMALLEHPARIFDILFFMQNAADTRPVLLTFYKAPGRWYQVS
jgi:hypothetical protein